VKYHIDSLVPHLHNVIEEYDGKIPWKAIGVFPDENSAGPPEAWWNSFVYTVGLTPDLDLWMPCTSIEGRYMGPQLTCEILNILGAAFRQAAIGPHDDIIVPLGVPDGADVDCVVWVGPHGEPSRYRQANFSDADWVVPIAWTSGLGWPDEDEE